MQTQPLSWLRQIHDELRLSHTIPLWGSPPPFPWEEVSHVLQKELEIPDLVISFQKQEISASKDFLTSFGKTPVIRTFELSPLQGKVYLVIASESLEKLSSLALSSEKTAGGLTDPDLQEGFYQYLLLCATKGFMKASPYPDLQMQWLETEPLPKGSSFCIDLSISFGEASFPIRLILSSIFHRAFSSHFSKETRDLFDSSLSDALDISLKMEIGSCQLAQADWKQLKTGDFLILDSCSYDPPARKGTVTLALENKQLFTAGIKKNKIKLLDYCTYHGERTMLDDENMLDDEAMNLEPLAEDDFSDDSETLNPTETPVVAQEIKETLCSSLDIPFPIVVEVDRVHMSLGKLLSLQPGNVLELPVQPEQGVYLTVHGKKVARGELIQLGDAIGVKIVELGDAPKA